MSGSLFQICSNSRARTATVRTFSSSLGSCGRRCDEILHREIHHQASLGPFIQVDLGCKSWSIFYAVEVGVPRQVLVLTESFCICCCCLRILGLGDGKIVRVDKLHVDECVHRPSLETADASRDSFL